MIGSFLTRGLVVLFGYAYPAYECFKTVEMNKPDIKQLRFWCQYWILVAILTVFERFGDNFISWVPMYSEAKLAFVIFLWCPKTKGTAYVYDSFFRPYMAKHETEIDRNLLELRTRAGEMAVIYCQKAASYGQTRIFDVLQYIAAQSAPRPPPAQPKQVPRPARQHSTRSQHSQQSNDEPPSPGSSTSSIPQVKEVGPEHSSTRGPSTLAPVTSTPIPSAPAIALAPVKKSVSMPAGPESSSQLADDVNEMQIEPVPAIVEKAVPNAPPPIEK